MCGPLPPLDGTCLLEQLTHHLMPKPFPPSTRPCMLLTLSCISDECQAKDAWLLSVQTKGKVRRLGANVVVQREAHRRTREP